MSVPREAFDYDKHAGHYDNHRKGTGPYIPRLVDLAQRCNAKRVVELGPGTANVTAAFLNEFNCPLLGIERSSEMLKRATSKNVGASFINGDASHIPLADSSADFIFACYVLHHIARPVAVFQECGRVLRDGYLAVITAPRDFIRNHPMNEYFPSFAKVDTNRFQSVDELTDAMTEAGFRDIETEKVRAEAKPIDHEYVDRVAGKFISTYALLPDDEFKAGLARLRADVDRLGALPEWLAWEAAIVWGRGGR